MLNLFDLGLSSTPNSSTTRPPQHRRTLADLKTSPNSAAIIEGIVDKVIADKCSCADGFQPSEFDVALQESVSDLGVSAQEIAFHLHSGAPIRDVNPTVGALFSICFAKIAELSEANEYLKRRLVEVQTGGGSQKKMLKQSPIILTNYVIKAHLLRACASIAWFPAESDSESRPASLLLAAEQTLCNRLASESLRQDTLSDLRSIVTFFARLAFPTKQSLPKTRNEIPPTMRSYLSGFLLPSIRFVKGSQPMNADGRALDNREECEWGAHIVKTLNEVVKQARRKDRQWDGFPADIYNELMSPYFGVAQFMPTPGGLKKELNFDSFCFDTPGSAAVDDGDDDDDDVEDNDVDDGRRPAKKSRKV